HGTNINALKVILFCIAAFLAGLGGALTGPVTGLASAEEFVAFGSLQLLGLLSIVHGAELRSALRPAYAYVLIPNSLDEWFGHAAHNYSPLLIGLAAIAAARRHNRADAGTSRAARAIKGLGRRKEREKERGTEVVPAPPVREEETV